VRFKLETDPCNLAEALQNFVDCAGRDRWKKRVLQLSIEATQSPFLAKIVADYHWLELVLSTQLIGLETKGELFGEGDRLECLAALQFAEMVTQTRDRLSAGAQATLDGRVRDGLKAETGYASLYLEMETARQLLEAGFEVEFTDLDGVGRYDLRFWNEQVGGEVECKSLSTDAGRKVHRKDFYRFVDAIGSELASRVQAQPSEVLLVTLDDRLPADSGRQKILRAAAVRMLKEPRIESIHESFFSISREPLQWRISDLNSASEKEFYQLCRNVYGNACHVSGALTESGGCLLVMKSRKEDDHSKPLLEAMKKAATQFSGTRPGFIAVQFDDLNPRDLLLPHLRRRMGLLSQYLFNECPADHVAATYFRIYGGLTAFGDRIGSPGFAIPNPKAKFQMVSAEYGPFLAHLPDAEFARRLGAEAPSENLSYMKFEKEDD
jgi:hypothetical protein